MSKEYKCLVSSKILIYNVVRFSIVILFFGVICLFADNPIHEKILFMLGIFIVFFLVGYFPYRNFYSVTYISKEGIRNRHLSIRWNEIKEYKLYEYNELGRYPKIKFPIIVCIGDTAVEGNLGYSPKKAVCFSLTRKNLKIMADLCADKNETIMELLSWSNFPIQN